MCIRPFIILLNVRVHLKTCFYLFYFHLFKTTKTCSNLLYKSFGFGRDYVFKNSVEFFRVVQLDVVGGVHELLQLLYADFTSFRRMTPLKLLRR